MNSHELVKAGLELMAVWLLAPLACIPVLFCAAWMVVTLKERRR